MKKKIVLTDKRYSMLMDLLEDGLNNSEILQDSGWEEEDIDDFVDNIFHPLYNSEDDKTSVKIVIKGYKNPIDFELDDEEEYMGEDLCGSDECPDDGSGDSCGSDECPNLTVENEGSNGIVECCGCCECGDDCCCEDDELPDAKDVWNANEAWRA